MSANTFEKVSTAGRRFASCLALAAAVTVGFWTDASEAAFFGLPKALRSQVDGMSFDAPVLLPIGDTMAPAAGRLGELASVDCAASCDMIRNGNVRPIGDDALSVVNRRSPQNGHFE